MVLLRISKDEKLNKDIIILMNLRAGIKRAMQHIIAHNQGIGRTTIRSLCTIV